MADSLADPDSAREAHLSLVPLGTERVDRSEQVVALGGPAIVGARHDRLGEGGLLLSQLEIAFGQPHPAQRLDAVDRPKIAGRIAEECDCPFKLWPRIGETPAAIALNADVDMPNGDVDLEAVPQGTLEREAILTQGRFYLALTHVCPTCHHVRQAYVHGLIQASRGPQHLVREYRELEEPSTEEVQQRQVIL